MPNAPKRSQNPPLPVRAAASAASRARALRIAGVSTVPRTAASMVATSMARLGGSFFGAAGSGGVGFCKNGLPYLHHVVSESRAVAAEAAGSGALEQRAQRAILRRKVASKATKPRASEFCAKNWARFHRVLHRSHNPVGSVVLLNMLSCCIYKSAQITATLYRRDCG